MKRFLFFFFTTVLVVVCFFIDARAAEPMDTVAVFFEASEAGNVKTIKSLIAGPFLDSRRVLLEENKDYPNKLREFYRGVTIEIVNEVIGNDKTIKKAHPEFYTRSHRMQEVSPTSGASMQNGNSVAVVRVRRHFPGGSAFDSKFLLRKDKDAAWKIFDEVLAN